MQAFPLAVAIKVKKSGQILDLKINRFAYGMHVESEIKGN